MKIIGRGEGATYIGELTMIEMSHLMGFMSYSELARSEEGKKLKIGDEIKLSDIFYQLRFYAQHGQDLANVAVQLQKMAEQLILINPIVHKEEPPC